MAFFKNSVRTFLMVLLIRGSSTADWYAVTHPSYSGKLLQHPLVEQILLYNISMKNTSVSASSVVQRNILDAKCRTKCLAMDGGSCRTFQTYWTTSGSFYCELLNTTLCNSCTNIANQGAGQLQSQIWETIQPDGFNPVRPCGVLPDWKVPGNCSLCGKIGFYGRNCSLRSSCASYFYETASPIANLSAYTTSSIAPCFTQGTPISTWCRGPFTFWFKARNTTVVQGFWNNGLTFTGNYSSLLSAFQESAQVLGSIKRNLLVATYPVSPYSEYLFLYSGFTLGLDGSLTISSLTSMTGISSLPDGLQTPLTEAPFLRTMTGFCGPMWLTNQGVYVNSTHVDSCASYSRFFGNGSKWALVDVSSIVPYIDIDYFQC